MSQLFYVILIFAHKQ